MEIILREFSMHLLSPLLFGISASLDALIVGIAYSLRRIRIRLRQNLLISLITLLGTCISVGLGALLSPFLPPTVSLGLGSSVLILMGCYYMLKSIAVLLKKQRCREDFPAHQSRPSLSLPEVCILSLGLSANNIGIGLSASIAGISLLPTAAFTFACSVFFLFLGSQLGKMRILKPAAQAADFSSGLLLVLLGIRNFCR